MDLARYFPIEIEEVLSRIAILRCATQYDDKFIDTVVGYRRGNWSFEWSLIKQMIWRQKRYERPQREAAADCWLRAANLRHSVRLYPFSKYSDFSCLINR